MAAEPSDGLGGPPGDRWRNPTDRVWWQWVSSLRKPCAVCLRRHGRLFPGPDPPERPHPHCECEFIEVRPGAEAPIEFRSPGGLAAAMPVGGQVELVGPLNWPRPNSRVTRGHLDS